MSFQARRMAAGAVVVSAIAPATAEAHTIPCARSETGTTFGIAALLAVVALRPWRMTRPGWAGRLGRLALPLMLAAVLTTAGCGGKSTKSTSATARPVSGARVQIVEPTANAVVGTDPTLQLDLIGARVVQPSQGALRGDEGHIHVTVDGRLVSMAYGTTQTLPGLTPGTHSVRVEFVAVDHLPFRNPVVAAVIFTVSP